MVRAGGIGLAALGFGFMAGAAPAAAQVDVAATASVTTDYRFRGISQTERDPAVQATLDLSLPDGLFVGAFGSTVSAHELNGADAEVDLYGGYTGKSGGLSYSLSALGYLYPGGRGVSYGEGQAELGYLIGPVQSKLFAAYAPRQRNTGGDDLYLGGSLSAGIPTTPLTATVGAGYEDGFFDGKWDWQAQLAYDHGPLTVSAAYVDTSLTDRDPAARYGRAGLIGTVGLRF